MKKITKNIEHKFFNAISYGKKNFEIRKDKDNIQPGDKLVLVDEETKERLTVEVCYVLRGYEGIKEGFAIFGLSPMCKLRFV